MATVFLACPTNSTLFTTCCEVAILDSQANCPGCGQKVYPDGRTERWQSAFGPIKNGKRGYGNFRPNDKPACYGEALP
jgi:hypothetical protein